MVYSMGKDFLKCFCDHSCFLLDSLGAPATEAAVCLKSGMEQSAEERARCARKKVKGDRKRRSQRVGISLTSMKKAAKMNRIRRRFPRKSTPEKLRAERFARLENRDLKKLRKAITRTAAPTRGS